MRSGANDNGHDRHYRKQTFDDGMTLWGAPALSHAIKLAGGPSAWAEQQTAHAKMVALEIGITAALKAYDDQLRAEGRLIDEVARAKPILRVVR